MTRRRAALLLVTALAATAALAAATAKSAEGGLIGTGAASGCDMAASHPFEAWGDNANYLLVPGGSFEAGLPAWTLSRGAYVSPGNGTRGSSFGARASGAAASRWTSSSGTCSAS
jgi:hypothetical protein